MMNGTTRSLRRTISRSVLTANEKAPMELRQDLPSFVPSPEFFAAKVLDIGHKLIFPRFDATKLSIPAGPLHRAAGLHDKFSSVLTGYYGIVPDTKR